MALELPNSIFFHLGRTAGHWVRSVIRQMELPTQEIGGFHAWPSQIDLSEAQRGKLKFCFIRHPLEWLRSFWMHEMCFGWEDNDFSRATASDNFSKFLENAIGAFEGPVSAVYAPFITQCDFVGRQEDLVGGMLTALGLARENFIPAVLYRTGTVSVGIPEEFRRAAVAPESLLREVMAREGALCDASWGYNTVPPSMIGEPVTMVAPYVPLVGRSGPVPDEAVGDGPVAEPSETSRGAAAGEVAVFDNAFRIGDLRVAGRKENRRTTRILREALDTIDFSGRTVLDTACGDGVFARYAAGRGASRVVAVDRRVQMDAAAALDRLLGPGPDLREGGFYGLDATLGERFDVVFCFRLLETLRYPFLALRTLGRLLNDGGLLVLECSYLEALEDKPLLMCPLGSEAPASSQECSYFNRKGLLDSLAAFGFTDVTVHDSFLHGLDRGRGFAALNFDGKEEWNDSETVIGRMTLTCRWAPDRAAADPRFRQDEESPALLLDRWDSLLPASAIPAQAGDSQLSRELHGIIADLKERIRVSDARILELATGLKDRERDLVEAWSQRDALGRDLVSRTEDLVATREELRMRTERLEKAVAELVELRQAAAGPPSPVETPPATE